ncbi:hypothetical protein D3C73_1327500 [compost metagenome]
MLITLAVTGTLFHALSRPGLFISLLLVLLIGISDIIVQRKRKKKSSAQSASAGKEDDEADEEANGYHITGIRLRRSKVK